MFDAAGTPVNREAVIVAASQGMVDKGGYRHFMEKEIHEQPEAIAHTLAAMTGPQGTLSTPLAREELQSIDGIVMLAAEPAIMRPWWPVTGLKPLQGCRCPAGGIGIQISQTGYRRL